MKISTFSRVQYIGPPNLEEMIFPGDIGYVIEDYEDGNFEVEFSDINGTTRAQAVLPFKDLVPIESER